MDHKHSLSSEVSHVLSEIFTIILEDVYYYFPCFINGTLEVLTGWLAQLTNYIIYDCAKIVNISSSQLVMIFFPQETCGSVWRCFWLSHGRWGKDATGEQRPRMLLNILWGVHGNLVIKGLELSLLWLQSLLWHGFEPWPRSFHMPCITKNKNSCNAQGRPHIKDLSGPKMSKV